MDNPIADHIIGQKLGLLNRLPWLAKTLVRIPDHQINKIDELLPWNAR